MVTIAICIKIGEKVINDQIFVIFIFLVFVTKNEVKLYEFLKNCS